MLKFLKNPEGIWIQMTEVGAELVRLDFKTFFKTAPAMSMQLQEDFEVETLEGTMKGSAGDYLMQGVNGELYPCAKDIFEKSYMEVGEPAEWIRMAVSKVKADRDYIKVVGSLLQVKIQNEPVKLAGKNGAQISVLLEIFQEMVNLLNQSCPCDENIKTLAHIEEAIRLQNMRTRDRESRGVEGTNNQ